MKDTLAENILTHVKDYRKEYEGGMSIEKIITWADQFGDDSVFILNELSHIIPNMYLSREKAKHYVDLHLTGLAQQYNYQSFREFLMDTDFLNLQGEEKSQSAIINIANEIIQEKYSVSIDEFITFPKRNFVYFDDVLATGSTMGRQIIDWIQEDGTGKILEELLSGRFRLSVNLFCVHTWAKSFQIHRFNKAIHEMLGKKIIWKHDFLVVENHAKFPNEAFNNAFPVKKGQPDNVDNYLVNLSAEKYNEYAYRNPSMPNVENFFSSKENRLKYENIILQKGLSIIEMIKGEIKPNVRPLGLINPAYKTFGLGTHFVTWRNIPNNCPLVYWWEVPGHDWIPLFPRKIV